MAFELLPQLRPECRSSQCWISPLALSHVAPLSPPESHLLLLKALVPYSGSSNTGRSPELFQQSYFGFAFAGGIVPRGSKLIAWSFFLCIFNH